MVYRAQRAVRREKLFFNLLQLKFVILSLAYEFQPNSDVEMAKIEEIAMVVAYDPEQGGNPEVHPRDPVRDHHMLSTKSKAVGSMLINV